MRKLFAALVFTLAFAPFARGQSTAVTGTATDSQATPYIGGTWTVTLKNTSTSAPIWQGSTSFRTEYGGSLDSTGSLAVTLPSNTGTGAITVGGLTTTQWQFNICARDGGTCFVTAVTITGTSQSISASLVNSSRITFTDGEPNQPPCGSNQVIVSLGGTSWGCVATAAINVPGGSDTQVQFNDAGIFAGSSKLTLNKTTGALTSTSTPAALTSITSGTSQSNGFQVIGNSGVNVAAGETGAQIYLFTASGDINLNPGAGKDVVVGGPSQSNSGSFKFVGTTSGLARLGVADAAGTPNRVNIPTSTGAAGALLTTNGGNPQQTAWTNQFTYSPSTGAVTSAGDAYLKSGRPWIDVLAYGADPTGVADSTSAFQAALNVWKVSPGSALGGILYIPSGIYLITTSLDATGVTYGGIVEGVGVSSQINCQLSTARPCFDFTGSQFVVFRDAQVNGMGAGSQSAAILNARAQSNVRGDFPWIENVFVQGTFSKAAFVNISADQGTYARNVISPTSVPTGIFLGCSDILGVTSAYQTFATAQGCTYYHVADSSFAVTTPTTTANVSTIAQSGTTLTITVPAASPVAQGQTFTLSGTLSTTATTLTVLTSTQGVISGTTSGAHGLVVGDRAVIAGVTPAGLNKTCTIATVPTGTTFTCNAGNGLADLVGTVFGTVTRTWDEDYVAATVSGSTITTTMATTVTDTGSAAGTIEISGEGIRAQNVAALQVDNTFFGFLGNGTAAVRLSGTTVATNTKMYNVRIENNNSIPLTHVVDAYSVGMGMADINGRFNVLGSLFRAGVGQTISRGRFMVVPAGSDSTELLFDGGANVSQVDVMDGAAASYSFNIGSGSAQNHFFHPTGKSKQFIGGNSVIVDGTATWMSSSNTSYCLYDTDTCSTTGRINLPNNKFIYEKNAAANADIGLVGLDGGNSLHLNTNGSNNVYVDAGQFGFNADNAEDIGTSVSHRPRTVYAATSVKTPSYLTDTNCSSSASPAVCGSAAAGSVVIAAGATTVTVNTTAVTANSQIMVFPDETLGTKLGVTCNSTLATAASGLAITARTAATSFQISTLATIAVNPVCLSYTITN